MNKSDYGFSVLINKKTKLFKIFMVSTKYFEFLLKMEKIKYGINLSYIM